MRTKVPPGGSPNARPTLMSTGPSARPFLDLISSGSTLNTLMTRAKNAGWVGSREAGCWDGKVSDAIAVAAAEGVLELLRGWVGARESEARLGKKKP